MRNVFVRNVFLVSLVLAAAWYLVLPVYWNRTPSSTRIIPYSTFVSEARQGHVDGVVVRDGDTVDGTFKDGTSFRTHVVPGDTSYLEILLARGVAITAEPAISIPLGDSRSDAPAVPRDHYRLVVDGAATVERSRAIARTCRDARIT